jgi:hypothetical protein
MVYFAGVDAELEMSRSEMRDALQRLTDLSELLKRGILELHDTIPATLQEGGQDDLGQDAPLSTRLRAALLCILADAVEPAIRDLRRLLAEAGA